MKVNEFLTTEKIKDFEQGQKRWGTKIALHNTLWTIFSDLFKGIGATGISTRVDGEIPKNTDKP